jgi:hypothetical protein
MMGWIILPVDKKFVFKDSDALFGNPQIAADGLRGAAPALAKAIANELAKR